jgi:hypothetical protein
MQRHAADPEPSIFSVGSPQALFHLERFPRRQVGAPRALDEHEVVGMDRYPPALARQAVLGKTGVVPPGLIDEIEGAVAPVARGQRREGVDRHLKLSFGLATGLLGPPSLGVLDLQRCVESFELLNGRLQVIACAPERLCCVSLRRVQHNHEHGRDRKQDKARYVLERHCDRMHRGQEKVIESRNGERSREQTRANAPKPRREHDRAEKQGYEWSGFQEPV